MAIGTAMVVLSSQFPVIRRVSEYSVHLMLMLLAIGMSALLINKKRIMFTALACSAMLCVFLKDASNSQLKLTEETTATKIKVAHVNLANVTYDFEEVTDKLKALSVDVVIFQELTPNWVSLLKERMKDQYPYSQSKVRIDPYGMAVYSRIGLSSCYFFESEGIPNINATVNKNGTLFQIISSYLTPALDNASIQKASDQLDVIASKITSTKLPIIALGEYNMVYWTNELKTFRSSTRLTNSRRDISQSNLRVPYDHIFFSDKLVCTSFDEVVVDNQYLGIFGTYQIKPAKEHHTLNSQLSRKM